MKLYLKRCTGLLIAILLVYNFGYIFRNKLNIAEDNNIKQVSRVNNSNIEIYNNGKWEKTFLKGVNMGAAKPGYFPGEFGITKDDYLRWFKQIKDMNANVIRVYTLQMPSFYEALYEFNRYSKEPLYIIHGVWVDEHTMLEEMDAFSPKVINSFKDETSRIIDVMHGNAEIEKVAGRGDGVYSADISPYVIGYILGIEWDPYFSKSTNDKNNKMKDFNGEWLYTENAQPMEIFLASVGDHAIDYETKKYKSQKPIAFANWLTTDIIDHDNDMDEANRIVNIDERKIKHKDSFNSGLFVSYHVYPYYPDFLNYDPKYMNYVDENGEKNSYKAYLKDLIGYYENVPVIVSEFGVPTSRGITHEDLSRGFNQGMINETQQGEMNKQMLEDIYTTGYAGAIIFSWQDEWFKRTWNTMEIDDPEGRAYWADKMTNEQFFGLLSFDSGYSKSTSYVDGNVKEWKPKNIVSESDNIKLYMKSDESYLYFRVNKKDLDLEKEEIVIPIDITPKSGSKRIKGYNIEFNKDADFIIKIGNKENSNLSVQKYYDVNEYLFSDASENDKNTDEFSILKQNILGESQMPKSKVMIEKKEVEVGKLIYGNGNPKSKNYNSLADYIVNKDNIEIRIPWLMLNISNPSKGFIIDDFNEKKEIKHFKVENINAGAYVLRDKSTTEYAAMKVYSWDKWSEPVYHERLKKSYSIIKDAFENLD